MIMSVKLILFLAAFSIIIISGCSEEINNPDPVPQVDPAERFSGGATTTFIFIGSPESIITFLT